MIDFGDRARWVHTHGHGACRNIYYVQGSRTKELSVSLNTGQPNDQKAANIEIKARVM